jgi:enoyl-CoA hydratase/carnithine racemase
VPVVSFAALLDAARSPLAADVLGLPTGGGWVRTRLADGPAGAHPPDALAHLAAVTVAIGDLAHVHAPLFDVVVPDDATADDVVEAIDAHPIASSALALLLRGGAARTVAAGQVAESSTYSTLQSGPEHRAWLAARRAPGTRARTDDAPVGVARDGGTLHVTLHRPDVHNAYNAATRDALLDALAIATNDDTITRVAIDGVGPSFCSGGDLDEFGTLSDPASAHVLRVARSVALALHSLRDRVTVTVHGACVGAGIELPAFAGEVVARADATFRLPEVAMGLVPGAGGTVSIPRRVGRHRFAWMALTGTPLDAVTALDWGLVDAVTDPPPN